MEIGNFRISRLDAYNFIIEEYSTRSYRNPKNEGKEETVTGWKRILGYYANSLIALKALKQYIVDKCIDECNYEDALHNINNLINIIKDKVEIIDEI